MSKNVPTEEIRRPLDRLLRPQSIVVAGVSPQKGSAGLMVLANLENQAYGGPVHIVSRGRTEVSGRACHPGLKDIPRGVDVAVLCVPRDAVLESIEDCASRGVGAAVVFASGFAELGAEGEAAQRELVRAAEAAGMALLGPNCFGYQNNAHNLAVSFSANQKELGELRSVVGIVAQSGGMGVGLRRNLEARGIGSTYFIATGNEAALGVEDFVADIIEDEATRVIAVLAEHLRKPQLMLQAARRARELGKAIVLMHPGRSARAREAARSHTGALAGDHAIMRALLSHEAVIVLESFQEWQDVTALLARYPEPVQGGVGVITSSGAFRGMTFDLCEQLGLAVPAFGEATLQALRKVLPSFSDAANPVDLTTQLIWQKDLVGTASQPLVADPAVGSIVIALTAAPGETSLENARLAIPYLQQSKKPVVYTTLSNPEILHPDFRKTFREGGIPYFHSSEAALVAVARLTAHGKMLARADERVREVAEVAPLPRRGLLAEFEGKAWLARAGIPCPEGGMAKSPEAALEIARRIGYPVVLKAQARDLTHKSDAGGVALNIADDPSLSRAWTKMEADISRAHPGMKLDGILVERMMSSESGARGIEMVVGARRDPHWGPVLMVGLGGVWIETLNDVRLMPADLGEARIVEEILNLRGAKLLQGARGTAPADVAALARVAGRVGALVRATPGLKEIDINPLLVYPQGRGVMALDALIVAE